MLRRSRCVKRCNRDATTSFHRIPKDSQQRDIWLDLLDLPETTNGRVCSKHFEAKDFEIKCDGSVWLKRNACPMQCDEPDEIEYIEMVDTEFTSTLPSQTSPPAIVNAPHIEPVTIPLKKNKECSAKRTTATVVVPDAEPHPVRLSKNAESPATQATPLDVPITIKSEPELDIEYEQYEELEFIDESITTDNLEDRLAPTTAVQVDVETQNVSTIPNGLQLGKESVKCNVCGMIFPKCDDQTRMLGQHFLNHKTNETMRRVVKKHDAKFYSENTRAMLKMYGVSKKVVKKYPEPYYQKERHLSNTETYHTPVKKTYGRWKEPLILNKLLKRTEERIKPISEMRTYEKKRKTIESVPQGTSHRLHSNESGSQEGVVIGSTLIKPIRRPIILLKPIKRPKFIRPVDKVSIPASTPTPNILQAYNAELERSDDAVVSDADEDVQIVEQTPELIVIDDNDEI